ncbi:hypothetical protein DFH06DRAFT_1157592 [Mycena polygramma]|nr:hypothetical protein DFH06DRAFT_1157592 [Mycena polygramma]
MDTVSSTLLLGQTTTCSFEQHAKSMIHASEANISRIDSQIRDLMRLRHRERGLIASLKLAIAPIRKLPAEILVEIFCYVHASSWWYLTGPRSNVELKRVLAISQVCAHWRQVVCTTPQLWAVALPIKLGKPPSDPYLSMAKTLLERSSPFPIPVTLDLESRSPARLIDLLFSTAPRWQSLNLRDNFSARFREMPPNTLANLTDVAVDIRGPLPKYPVAVKAFLSAPRLRRVDLDVEDTTNFPMPWAQLTHLTLSESSPQISLDILLQCTSICKAKFKDMQPWAIEPGAGPPVTLPQLKHLEAQFEGDSLGAPHIMPFFARLGLPALKDLNVSAGWENVWSSTVFTQFQTRSPNLERLWINNSYLEPEELIAILLAAPNLIELGLELCPSCIDDSVLQLLRYTDQAVPVVPQLQTMLAWGIDDDFSEGPMRKMVQSRWWSDEQLGALPAPPAVARWKRLSFGREECVEHSPFSLQFQAKMELFRSQGLNIDIH